MIEAEFEARILAVGNKSTNLPVSVELSWYEYDCLAVEVWFAEVNRAPVDWHFSFELLAVGSRSTEPYGEGDVKFRLIGDDLLMCLSNEDGHADIVLPAGEVHRFVAAVIAEADDSDELEDDLDAALKEILG